ncbi:GntR family transcriptional regulator [Streptomyces canus]|uniref:GntR family transcriptional regulator n=1 Tax=Streptomyces canus TaxID=58343 RepID=UPI003406B653
MTTFSGNAISRPPALIRDQVAAQIRDAIADLRLLPGQVLVERELCESTTASRATVREALRQLQSEGLVTSTNGKGTVVATLSVEQAQQIYEVRSALEGLAGRLFAERATAADRRALRSALLAVEEAAPNTREMLLAKSTFYAALMKGANNAELETSLAGLNRRATLVRAVSLTAPGRVSASLAELAALCEAAVNGEGALAEELARKHIENAAKAGIPLLQT